MKIEVRLAYQAFGHTWVREVPLSTRPVAGDVIGLENHGFRVVAVILNPTYNTGLAPIEAQVRHHSWLNGPSRSEIETFWRRL